MNGTHIDPARLRDTRAELTGASESWFKDVTTQLRLLQVTASRRAEPRRTLDKVYQLTRGLTEANVQYMQGVARASLGLLGGVRSSAAGGADAANDDIVSAIDRSAQTGNRVEDDVLEATADLRRDQLAGAGRYEGMTKVQLSEELGERGLKKSGKVDELRERLIDDDLEHADA
jgi:hypothetical protein